MDVKGKTKDIYTHIHAEKLANPNKQLSKGERSNDHLFKVILGENMVIFIPITLVMMYHVGVTDPIIMRKSILIVHFHRYLF